MIPQILNLLILPPGNLLYHLVLAFSSLAAIQSIAWQAEPARRGQNRRTMMALMVVLLAQLVLFISSGLVWQGIADPQLLLPPLDRAMTTISLLWIAWLWAFPDSNRAADILHSVLTMGIIVFFLVTLTGWNPSGEETHFNSTMYDLVWTSIQLAVTLVGSILLLVRKPIGWGIGFGFLIVNFAGILAHLLWPLADQDFAGYIRLAQVATYPLIPTLARRMKTSEPAAIANESSLPYTHERRRYSADVRTVGSWLDLSLTGTKDQTGNNLLKAVAQTMLADLTFFLVAEPYSGEVTLSSGYDLIREEFFSGKVFNASQAPLLTGALQRGKPARIGREDKNTEDLDTFASLLNLTEPGSALAVPLNIPETAWAGLVLLSPYSNRVWSADDQSYLSAITDRMNQLLASPKGSETGVPTNLQLAQELAALKADLERKKARVQELEAAYQPAPDHDMQGLLAIQQESQEIIARLEKENKQLRTNLQLTSATLHSDNPSGTASEQIEAELRLTLQEVAQLRNDLAANERKLANLQQQHGGTLLTEEDQELLTSTVQELRQPLSTISGYTDLLLGERVGILGDLQQKFLEKIKSSGERMKTLLDELLEITHFQTTESELKFQQVDIHEVIDQIIADTRPLLREKKLNLRLDLADELPPVAGDPEAIKQVLIHLLNNAREVSSSEGTVILRAQLQQNGQRKAMIQMQVTDFGGGIAQSDLQRVFTRIYRADHALISGIGDSGTGLSIAKALVEAQGGQIWVESDQKRSTTFYVALPADTASGTHISEAE